MRGFSAVFAIRVLYPSATGRRWQEDL